MKRIFIGVLLITLLLVGSAFDTAEKKNTHQLKDIEGHWAEQSINKALEKGYVNGYSDNTFRPNENLSRAEFITMVVRAMGEEPSKNKEGKWYMPYMRTAYEKGWFDPFIYREKYDKLINRKEISYTLVTVTNAMENLDSSLKQYTTKDQKVIAAIANGLLTGNNIGDVRLKEFSTRAEAIVFIERMLTVLNGGKLAVDELALSEYINPTRDLWGNKFRTTNLPANYESYPYILEYLPNEVYTMGQGDWPENTVSTDGYGSPAWVFKTLPITVEKFEPLKKNIETWFDLSFNIDYKTIDKKWSTKLNNTHKIFCCLDYISGYNEHVEWVKKNKVKTKLHKIIIEPSTMRYSNYRGSKLRVYYQYSVVSGDKKIFENQDFSNKALFRGQTRKHDPLFSNNYKFGDKITVVSEILINWNYQITPAPWDVYQVTPDNDLSANFIIIK